MNQSWVEIVKKFIGLDVLFGPAKKKMAGINDAQCTITTDLSIDTVDDSITFTGGDMPDWVKVDKYFRIIGGANDGELFRVKEIVSSNKIVIYEDPVTDSGTLTFDARLWVVHQDNTITRKSPSGGTMFNLDNLNDTGVPEDGSCLAKVPVAHYHAHDAWKVNIVPIGDKNNQNLIFILPNSETFVYGQLEVYLSGLHLNGDQSDPDRDYNYLPDLNGFEIILRSNNRWGLNRPPLQGEPLTITYLQDLE